jgi:phosphotriesterase-related protein
VKAIGRTVREQASVGRVITFGGQLSSTQNIFDAVEEKEGGYIGINAPRSGAYKQGFQVVHMGYGVDEQVQVPAQLFAVDVPTVLVGKVADIVSNPHGISWENLVDSQQIMEITRAEFNRRETAFICTNIQETDLAGHAEDVERYVDRLELVDEQLALLMADMRPDDCLVVMADHGNDPTIGHSKHTREKVPLLVWSRTIACTARDPAHVVDVGATVCDFLVRMRRKMGALSFRFNARKEYIMMIDSSGYTYAHEHLHIDLSGFKGNIDCRLDQYELISNEMRDLMHLGVRNIVEMTNRYMGRNPSFMLDLMRDTGINVIACTGYYQHAFFPEHVATRSVQELAQEMIDEIEIGIDGTPLKAGIIAEIGSSEGVITDLEAKVFSAAALAHNATGRPISTHTSFSTMGLEQLALLKQHGVDLSRVVIGHCDLKDNLDDILRMIDLGAYVQFDTIGKNNYYPDAKRIAMLLALRERGCLDHVMLSMDITRRSHLKANGGNGYDYLLTTFVPQLYQAGFSQADVDLMLRTNPTQFFL